MSSFEVSSLHREPGPGGEVAPVVGEPPAALPEPAFPRRVQVLRGAGTAEAPAAILGADLVPKAVEGPPTSATVSAARRAGYDQGYAAGAAAVRARATEAAETVAQAELALARAELDATAEALRAALEAAEAARSDETRRVLSALAGAVGDLERRAAAELTGVEDAVAEAAFELASIVLGRELVLAASPGRDAVARALALAPERGPVTLRLHPDDLAALGAPADALAELAPLAPGRDISLVADPGVELGGCLLEAGATRVDAQLGPALERVRRSFA